MPKGSVEYIHVVCLHSVTQVDKPVELLGYAARYYELEASTRIQALTIALEPMMLGVVGLGVGLILVAVFLPMYSYLGQLGA